MPPLTFFAAALECPNCGAVTKADTSTNMSSHLMSGPGEHILRVGDRPDVNLGDFESAYLTIRLPEPGAAIHVLETWSCPACGSGNWAEIVFHDGEVKSIESVSLSQASLDRAHFISERVYEDFERLVGQSLWENNEVRPDFAQMLKARLPAA